MMLFYLIVLGLLGACVGSFLNVVIYRVPLEISVNNPRRSFCPTCCHSLAWYDNIPVLAYLYLRGQCRYCGTAYGARYPLVELLTAALFALVGYRFGLSLAAGVYLIFVSLMIVVAFIDLDHFVIPTVLIWIGGATAVIALAVVAYRPEWGREMINPRWMDCLIGAVFGYGSLWLIRFVASIILGREAMGLGDLDLMALFGLYFGWQSLLLILLISSLIGSILGLIHKHRKGLGAYTEIPYGPFLVVAALAYLFIGQEMIATLWGHLGLIEAWNIPSAEVRPWW